MWEECNGSLFRDVIVIGDMVRMGGTIGHDWRVCDAYAVYIVE